jgi:hypothetical protein
MVKNVGRGSEKLHSFLTSAHDEIRAHLHAKAVLSPGREPSVQFA